MNGELNKNTFFPTAPYVPDSAGASSGDSAVRDTQSPQSAQQADPMQLSMFGDDVHGGTFGGVATDSTASTSADSEHIEAKPLLLLTGIDTEDSVQGAGSDATDTGQAPADSTAGVRGRSGGRRHKKIASILTAFFCLSSAAAYICAGFFIADTVMERGLSLFENELMAASPSVPATPADTEMIIPAVKPAESESADTDTPNVIPEYPVQGVSMAAHDPFAVANETKYTPDIAALTSAEAFAASRPDAAASSEEPLVLIVHTHATEAFLDEGVSSYNDNTTFRSSDPAQNMIAVGDELCRALGNAGITALHCTEMFDSESFIHSYEKSAAAVGQYLRDHPSIRYVLDVHRDAIFRQDGTLLAARTADGSAQVMLVCGSDEMGADFPDWQDNLAFAFSLQAAAKSVYPDLMRNVNLRGASFNEQLASRFLLVEVGSAGNTLDEAKSAARRFAEVFASVVAP